MQPGKTSLAKRRIDARQVGRHRKHKVKGPIKVATSGSNIRVRVAEPGDVSGGDDVNNIVSRLTAGGANGVQIEQGARARDEFGAAIAACHAAKLAVSASAVVLEPVTISAEGLERTK